jgi:hypothetical protein
VIADGGKPVGRAAVYGEARPARGHCIALAVKPPASKGDTGDYHFWRLDANGRWSYKVGGQWGVGSREAPPGDGQTGVGQSAALESRSPVIHVHALVTRPCWPPP